MRHGYHVVYHVTGIKRKITTDEYNNNTVNYAPVRIPDKKGLQYKFCVKPWTINSVSLEMIQNVLSVCLESFILRVDNTCFA